MSNDDKSPDVEVVGDGELAPHVSDKEPPDNLKYHPETVAAAIREADGQITAAADLLDCARNTVYSYCSRFEVCQKTKRLERAATFEKAQETLAELLDSDDDHIRFKAAKWVSKMFSVDVQQLTDTTDPETAKDALRARLEGGSPNE